MEQSNTVVNRNVKVQFSNDPIPISCDFYRILRNTGYHNDAADCGDFHRGMDAGCDLVYRLL